MFRHVLGIDPSLTATAIADAHGIGVYGGEAKYGDDRLVTISDAVERHLDNHIGQLEARYDEILAVMEDLPKHAHAAGITGMVQGVIRLALRRAGVSYALVIPSTLKAYATGRGHADKPDMRMELFKRTGIDERNDNKVDAWWLRQAGLDAIGHPDALRMPKAQRERLWKVRWPSGVALSREPVTVDEARVAAQQELVPAPVDKALLDEIGF